MEVERAISRDPDGAVEMAVGFSGRNAFTREKGPFLWWIDSQWPGLKFLGFGFYEGWILLCYRSALLVGGVESLDASQLLLRVYMTSTVALSVVLILAALVPRVAEKLLAMKWFVFAFGVVAAVGTVLTFLFCRASLTAGVGIAGCLTGFSTAFIALQLGQLYSTVPTRSATMYTVASFILTCMFYFVATGVSPLVGLIFLSFLPVAAAVCCLGGGEGPASPNRSDVSSAHLRAPAPSRGFMLRFFLGIVVFSTAVSVSYGASIASAKSVSNEGDGVLLMLAIGVGGFFLLGRFARESDIVKAYYPVVVLAGAAIIAPPLFSYVDPRTISSAVWQLASSFVVDVFALFVWCLSSQIAYVTQAPAVRVFGLARAASAIGTVLGQSLGGMVLFRIGADPATTVAVAVVLLFVLFSTTLLLFNERLVGEVFQYGSADDRFMSISDMLPLFNASDGDAGEGRISGQWTAAVEALAQECDLSSREREVLTLLCKGRTIGYIAEELGVSFNTVKTHVRNVYQKVGIHTRQELFDEVERRKSTQG